MASTDTPSTYTVIPRIPSPTTYYELRRVAGLTPPPPEDSAKALAGSWAAFVVVQGPVSGADSDIDSRTVGMGRLIGDGALFLDVVDIAIHPDHQRRGLGKKIMRALLDHADKNAPNAYISLVAEPAGAPLYAQFGFSDVKPSVGMYRCERVRLRKEAILKAWEEAQVAS